MAAINAQEPKLGDDIKALEELGKAQTSIASRESWTKEEERAIVWK